MASTTSSEKEGVTAGSTATTTIAAGDSDDEQDSLVREMQPKQFKCFYTRCLSYTAIACVFTVLVIVSVFVISYMAVTDAPKMHSDTGIDRYVLPNATLAISVNHSSVLSGTFVVDDYDGMQLIRYDFVSTSNASVQFIKFETSSVTSVRDWQWRGFTLSYLDDSALTFELIHLDNTLYTITISRTHSMSPADTQTVESFLGQIVCEHFVELSVKLGAIGYSGADNQPIHAIHATAQWIWKTAMDDENIDVSQWVDIEDEFEKVNAVSAASEQAGHHVETVEELTAYLADEDMPQWSNTNGRKLLGNCGMSDFCNNKCFGRCGRGCSCWSWVCGDCDCWLGCLDHDGKCCEGFFGYCCINVLWVRCDGSKTCSSEA